MAVVRRTHLATVARKPGHRKTVLAIARPLCLYFIGLPPYSANSLLAFVASVPVTYALFMATITVKPRAAEIVKKQASTEHIFQAIFTLGDSFRSGQKRSKKNAEPKIVAT